jgi:hypothetical protein
MAGAANALQKARDRAGRAQLADEVDVADINAEFEGGGGNQGLELGPLEPLLGIESLLLGEAAMMRCHVLLSKQVGEVACHTLGQPPRVDENEGRSVFSDQIGQPLIELTQTSADITASRGGIRDFQCQIAGATMSGIYDHGSIRFHACGAYQKPRDFLDRLLRGREADALQTIAAEAASRSRESAKWLPRLFGASA